MSKDKLTPLKIIEGAFDYFLDDHPVSSHAGEGVIQRLEEAGFVIVPKEMSEWKDIASAPKDGTEIDVWHYCHDPVWRPDDHGIENGCRYTNVIWQDGTWKRYDDGWSDYLDIELPKHYTTSHWMPLPKPPASK